MALLLAATIGGAASTPIAFALECRPGWERRGRRATAPLPRSAFTIAPCLAAFLAEKASPAVPLPSSSALEAFTQQPSSDSPSEAPPMCSSPSTGASLGIVKIQASELVVSIVSRCGSKHHSVSVCNRQFIDLHYNGVCDSRFVPPWHQTRRDPPREQHSLDAAHTMGQQHCCLLRSICRGVPPVVGDEHTSRAVFLP